MKASNGKEYPREFKDWAKNAKWYRLTDIPKAGKRDCDNCGGAQVMGIFLAKSGPFTTPGNPPYGEECMTYDPEAYNGAGGYWVGKTLSLPCPKCGGRGVDEVKPPKWVQGDTGEAFRTVAR